MANPFLPQASSSSNNSGMAIAVNTANGGGFGMTQASPAESLMDVEQNRAIAEVQAAMVIAKKFPRNQIEAMDRILQSCTRPTLAEHSLYTYARGGTDITGPSIRLAEAIAQNWGNIQFGIRELSQSRGESTVEAYAWDIESNTRQVKTFQMPHVRYTKAKGNIRLNDPRDIYELIANHGARRLRACILGIIPGDVVDAAVSQCETTLSTKVSITPERIQSMVKGFHEIGVTKEMLESRIQRRIDAVTPALMVQLGKIFNALKDGMSSVQDWFTPSPVTQQAAPSVDTATSPSVVGAENKRISLSDKIKKNKTAIQAPASSPSPSPVENPETTTKAEKKIPQEAAAQKSLRDAYMEVADLKEQFPQYFDELGLQPDSRDNCAKIVAFISAKIEAGMNEASKGTGENTPDNEIPFG